MNQFFNQFWKDFRQTVTDPVFFLVIGLCSAIWGFVFPRHLFEFAGVVGVSPFAQGGQQGYNIHETVFMSHLSITHLLLLFTVPILTMRLIAEEKKLGTFSLLLTAPITSTKIVLGKFFAAYCVVLLVVAVSFLYPMSVSLFTEFSIKLLLSSYLAIALLMAVYTAIGLFSSSLTSSILLSVFFGVALSVSLHFINVGTQSDNEQISGIASYLSLARHLENFFRGNLVSSSTLFFLIMSGFFIFLTQRVIESSRGES